jgi:hypothetical protein
MSNSVGRQPKFKYGDKVVAGTHKGKVISARTGTPGKDEYLYVVKFDNKFLIPPEMEYPEPYLKFENEESDRCPYCNKQWTITKFNKQIWKDCKECNEKSEVLLKDWREGKLRYKELGLEGLEDLQLEDHSGSTKSQLEKDFEDLLHGNDDDDFGYYGFMYYHYMTE